MTSEKYFQEDLSNDNDGRKWQLMFSSIIDKANSIEFTVIIAENEEELQSMIDYAYKQTQHLGLTNNLIEIYSTNTNFQRNYSWYYIIARLSIDSELKAKISNYKTLLDLSYDFINPAFYYNKTALLWTVSTESFANILLTDNQRLEWRKDGFVLDIDNGNIESTEKLSIF